MNQSIYHPEQELLASYSAASLPLSQALCISVHLEHCAECARQLKRLDLVGGELLDQVKPSRPTAALKDRLLNQLDDLVDENKTKTSQSNIAIPRCLHQFVSNSYQQLSWKRISSDIQSCLLCRDSNGAKVELLRIRPGGSATTHTHLGDEYTVILEGSFSDEDGVYHRGDFLLRDASHEHTPVATLDQACICLAVTEAPIQFTGLFSRLLNPFVRRAYA